jgi:hypothetical protein
VQHILMAAGYADTNPRESMIIGMVCVAAVIVIGYAIIRRIGR